MSPTRAAGGGPPAADGPLSARNPKVQHLRRLLRRRGSRRDHGQFVVEGPGLVAEALAAGLPVEAVYLADPPGPAGDGDLAALAATAAAAGVPVHRLAPEVLARVADAAAPQPALAVVGGRPGTLADLVAAPARGLVVVLAGVADPGNAGTVVRTAEATGATAVVLTEGSVDPLGPKAVRAAAGSAFRVPLVEGPAPAEAVAALRAAGWRAVGTAAQGGTPYQHAGLGGDVAVVLGSEAHGLAAEVVAGLDELVTIPMAGRVESLNVAVAAALLCFEHTRRGVA